MPYACPAAVINEALGHNAELATTNWTSVTDENVLLAHNLALDAKL